MIKILYSPCHYKFSKSEGSESYWAYNIADKIASVNYRSIVVTGFTEDKNKKYRIIELQKNKTEIDLSLINALKFNFLYFFATIFFLKKENFDLVHHVLPFGIGSTFNLSVILGLTNNKPFIVGPIQGVLQYRDDDINNSNIRIAKPNKSINFTLILQKIFSFLTQKLSYKTLKKSDKIVVIDECSKAILIKNNVPREKIIIISPGIDCNKYKKNIRKKIRHKKIIMVSSYLLKRKAIDFVIKSYDEVRYLRNNTELIVVGDGPQKKNLEKLVKRLKLKNSVNFVGHVPNNEISKFYRKADIFVSMSRAESWGQMYLEAMASGLPIVSSRNVGSESIIKDGEFGYLVDQEDYKELAKKIIYLIDHPDVMERFGKKARKEVEEKYDWDRVVIPKYVKLYKQLINEK